MQIKLSDQARLKSSGIINDCILHPFNQELMRGSLPKAVFNNYLRQDCYFLRDFGKCHSIIESRINPNYKDVFSAHAKTCFSAEEKILSSLPKKYKSIPKSLATLEYNNYLLHACSYEPIEIAIAAILPCFWVYREVGMYIYNNSNGDNPYAEWISKYGNEKFSQSVNQMISMFDELADKSDGKLRSEMLETFQKSANMELQFWNDVFHYQAVVNR